jgi:polyphosphate kinase 2 (PPK2 family)
MHLGKKAQRRRLKMLACDPLQRWRVSKADRKNVKLYGRFIGAAERTIRRTDTSQTRWLIVEGEDPRYRSLAVLTTLRDGLRRHLAERAALSRVMAETRKAQKARRDTELAELHARHDAIEREAADQAKASPAAPDRHTVVVKAGAARLRPRTVLDGLDLSTATAKEAYAAALKEERAELAQRFAEARHRGLSAVLVFEGWDAAGKGGPFVA